MKNAKAPTLLTGILVLVASLEIPSAASAQISGAIDPSTGQPVLDPTSISSAPGDVPSQTSGILSSILPGVIGAGAGGLLGYKFGGTMGAVIGGIGGFLAGEFLSKTLFSASSAAAPADASASMTSPDGTAAGPAPMDPTAMGGAPVDPSLLAGSSGIPSGTPVTTGGVDLQTAYQNDVAAYGALQSALATSDPTQIQQAQAAYAQADATYQAVKAQSLGNQ